MDLKVLLVGPYPPPHGGVSVHVREVHQQMMARGIPCRVLNTARPRTRHGTGGLGHWPRLIAAVAHAARQQWTIHVHISGHSWTGWAVALACALASRFSAAGSVLTLHSGLTPHYLKKASWWECKAAKAACSFFTSVVCVNAAVQRSVVAIGAPPQSTQVIPAYLGRTKRSTALHSAFTAWLGGHYPILAATLFFRPEYGFDFLVSVLAGLREKYPSFGCVVMGGAEQREQGEKLVYEHGLAGNIWLAGDLDHETCLAVMAASDVFVRPTFHDGDSVSVREALALGVPVVASAVGVRPEGAFLFEPGDAAAMAARLVEALSAAKPAPEVGAGSWEQLLSLYRRVLAGLEDHAAA